MPEFSARLNALKVRADFTVSDLAVWFERPRPTVHTWTQGRTPTGPAGRRAERDLELLSITLRTDKRLPVPENLSITERPQYVEKVRDDARRSYRVPRVRVAV